MKITSIGLENFKGISEPVKIPISPITLLFGSNGSGKSTIFHAFLYLYEIIVNQNPNPSHSLLNGSQVELNGFESLVHNQDLSKEIKLKVGLDVSGDILSSPDSATDEYILEQESLRLNEPSVSEVEIEFVVAHSSKIGVYVKEYRVEIDTNAGVGKIVKVPGKNGVGFLPFVDDFVVTIADVYGDGEDSVIYKDIIYAGFGSGTASVSLNSQELAVPNTESKLSFGQDGWDSESAWDSNPLAATTLVESIFTQLMVSPLKLLKEKLKEICHLGPLRMVPPRGYVPNQQPLNWYDGSAAWDLFAYGTQGFQSNVNNFFGSEGFNSNYQFKIEGSYRNIKILDVDSNKSYEPSSLGVGISQSFPFVVGSLSPSVPIFFVEQPELHIHPSWQLDMGDLLIQAIKDNPNKLIFVETHSEHLMLRLLYRVRNSGDDSIIKLKNTDLSVVCIYKHEGSPYYQMQPVTEEGDFELDWPQGFFEERYGEL